jgi:hypothetical protein
MNSKLTSEQFAQYEAIVNEYDRYRKLSPEEKEDLIIRIATSTYLDLLSDWAFKHVFGHNEQNLMLLLNDILPEKIVHIDYDPNEIDLWKGDDKKVIMDVLCHTEDGRKIIVEMQRPGKSLTPVEVWFDILQNMRNFASKPELYGQKYDPIFESSLQSPMPDKDRLQYFRSMFDNELRSYLTDEDRQEIFAEGLEKGLAKGIEQGLTKGREEGREEEKIKTAGELKNLGVPVETISRATGLSADAIAAL